MSAGRFGAVIAAAGSGRRFGAPGGRPKQLLELERRPVLLWSLDVFGALDDVAEVVVVGPPERGEDVEALVEGWRREARPRASIRCVPGGATRAASVRLGIEALGDGVDRVIVHDAARPLIRRADVESVLRAIDAEGAAAIGHRITDSIREVREGLVTTTLDRDAVWQVQTPQGGLRAWFAEAYADAASGEGTDEVALLRAAGFAVRVVEGARDNIKVTHPGDLELAEFLLARARRAQG